MSSFLTEESSDPAKSFLAENKFPKGVQESMMKNVAKLPKRFFILDNSGSMGHADGQKLEEKDGTTSIVECTRWAELREAITFAANFAHEAQCETEFRFLNEAVRSGEFEIFERNTSSIVLGDKNTPKDEDAIRRDALLASFDLSPGGKTPLCAHIGEVVAKIQELAPSLRAKRQKAVVVIASDGCPTDGNLVEAMKPLQSLPVWMVVRLCTSEQAVVDFWNHLDEQLEVEMDVLDDYESEAKEIHECNPWFNYGMPLHRMREFGVRQRELDLLDEKALSSDQIITTCQVIYGGDKSLFPCPLTQPDKFVEFLTPLQERDGGVWNPLAKQILPWIQWPSPVAAADAGASSSSA